MVSRSVSQIVNGTCGPIVVVNEDVLVKFNLFRVSVVSGHFPLWLNMP